MTLRRGGLLLHITSLPGPLPNGVLGAEAIELLHRMRDAGCRLWQFLPLGPTHGHGSPYESRSTFAGNPELIDLRDCAACGLLDEALLAEVIAGRATMAQARRAMVARFREHWTEQEEWRRFLADNRAWLEDYALFSTIRRLHNEAPWWRWPQPLRDHDPAALAEIAHRHEEALLQVQMEQFLFDRQWRALKEEAAACGVALLGDLPIYVAHDSADVWGRRQLFTVNDEGLCDEVAGVPPDYFSENGQRWGNPLYRWERMAEEGFDWWVARVRHQLARVDLLRIDHFRGLEAYWAIPGDRRDGRVGAWRKAPGAQLLQTLDEKLGSLPLIAEDLGLITEEVHALRRRFGLPGMKILQFAFGGGADNPYLPHHHSRDMAVYTGTHDNDTTVGWWQSAPPEVRAHVRDYLGLPDACDAAAINHALMRQALASVADLAILPMQDLLGLDGTARLNTPGTVEGNWRWRLRRAQMEQAPWEELAAWNRLYDR
ncbi:MAG: 4-alpha-glucanotransferase [Zetaproteobacteria bacterium]|nr:MAG: 4-alpha-glucanotransferase [Zetaproteobacteria bacterium]